MRAHLKDLGRRIGLPAAEQMSIKDLVFLYMVSLEAVEGFLSVGCSGALSDLESEDATWSPVDVDFQPLLTRLKKNTCNFFFVVVVFYDRVSLCNSSGSPGTSSVDQGGLREAVKLACLDLQNSAFLSSALALVCDFAADLYSGGLKGV